MVNFDDDRKYCVFVDFLHTLGRLHLPEGSEFMVNYYLVSYLRLSHNWCDYDDRICYTGSCETQMFLHSGVYDISIYTGPT